MVGVLCLAMIPPTPRFVKSYTNSSSHVVELESSTIVGGLARGPQYLPRSWWEGSSIGFLGSFKTNELARGAYLTTWYDGRTFWNYHILWYDINTSTDVVRDSRSNSSQRAGSAIILRAHCVIHRSPLFGQRKHRTYPGPTPRPSLVTTEKTFFSPSSLLRNILPIAECYGSIPQPVSSPRSWTLSFVQVFFGSIVAVISNTTVVL